MDPLPIVFGQPHTVNIFFNAHNNGKWYEKLYLRFSRVARGRCGQCGRSKSGERLSDLSRELKRHYDDDDNDNDDNDDDNDNDNDNDNNDDVNKIKHVLVHVHRCSLLHSRFLVANSTVY